MPIDAHPTNDIPTTHDDELDAIRERVLDIIDQAGCFLCDAGLDHIHDFIQAAQLAIEQRQDELRMLIIALEDLAQSACLIDGEYDETEPLS
ncbi:MAG: hypothetical protein APF80_17440 [Alphaproteobacteria bacterium BRH_c36]|nr:MAG: hypothetical protein APF80_17440 [Alphaproteobacteria bacterium BRH_c36]